MTKATEAVLCFPIEIMKLFPIFYKLKDDHYQGIVIKKDRLVWTNGHVLLCIEFSPLTRNAVPRHFPPAAINQNEQIILSLPSFEKIRVKLTKSASPYALVATDGTIYYFDGGLKTIKTLCTDTFPEWEKLLDMEYKEINTIVINSKYLKLFGEVGNILDITGWKMQFTGTERPIRLNGFNAKFNVLGLLMPMRDIE